MKRSKGGIRGLLGRWGCRGDAVAVIIGVSLLGLLLTGAKTPRLSPAQHLNVLSMKIVMTARNIEDARRLEIIDEVAYTRAKKQVAEAVSTYNTLVGKYQAYGTVARSERLQVVAMLVAAAQTVKEVRNAEHRP